MLPSKNYSHIIWDWNGTLLNDAEWCLSVKNGMLARRGIKTLADIDAYRRVFGFPIKSYYQKIGFDFNKEPFEEIAEEYIRLYHANKTGNCRLHDDARLVLEAVSNKGIKQVVLSASEVKNLLSQINEFAIGHYFTAILGLTDIYAKSKLEVGLDYINRHNIKNAVLFGDTEHDYEVATKLGIDCLLIANGHNSKERLLACGVPVLDGLCHVIGHV